MPRVADVGLGSEDAERGLSAHYRASQGDTQRLSDDVTESENAHG